jgi:4-alpha-glucanotransferase
VSPSPAGGDRFAGILLHPTSLPGPFGMGDLGSGAERFLDWAAAAGFRLWQVLPLGPTGGGHSPYTCVSAFAGNPLLVSPESLAQEGLLPDGALSHVPGFDPARVDFETVVPWKEALLRRSWEHFRSHPDHPATGAFEAFLVSPERSAWLSDWSLYAALKADFGGRAWIRTL